MNLLESRLAERLGPRKRPNLRLVECHPPPSTRLDALTRESHCKMIRHIRWRRGRATQLIIDQACFGLAGIEQLDDDRLVALHRNMERAEDCIREGVSFEDAGLITSTFD